MSTMNYATGELKTPRRRWRWRYVLAGLGGIGLLGLLIVPTCKTWRLRIDSVTGSTRKETSWWGVNGVPDVWTSPMEKRLKAANIAYTPNWTTMSYHEFNAVGIRTFRGCSTAPPIYRINRDIDRWLPHASDEQLQNYVRVMQTGTETEQEAIVQAIGDKIFDE